MHPTIEKLHTLRLAGMAEAFQQQQRSVRMPNWHLTTGLACWSRRNGPSANSVGSRSGCGTRTCATPRHSRTWASRRRAASRATSPYIWAPARGSVTTTLS